MGDTEPLTARQAAQVIQRATAYEEPLRRRTEGVTWMVWGFATAAVIFMGVAFGTICGPPGLDPYSEAAFEACQPWIDYVWVPWLVAAIAATKAVWHIAALSLPKAGPGHLQRIALALVMLLVVSGLPFGVVHRLPGAPESAAMFFGLGAPWLALGIANLHRGTGLGRKVMAFIGAAMFVAGAVWLPLAAGLPNEGWKEATWVGGALAAGLPIAAGFWQTLRG
ncbi:MAG TPA: hypothetical protein VGR28_11075 [Candidatus Thermoplasmatota archaeon]|jgi:hypothetical protein|nr:hypothetical protein [Candidatus Thermoplasmatota archaeon]